jgi:hypothetical protein
MYRHKHSVNEWSICYVESVVYSAKQVVKSVDEAWSGYLFIVGLVHEKFVGI